MHLKYSGYDVKFYTTTLRLTMPRQLTSPDYENTVYGFAFFVVALFRVQEDRKKVEREKEDQWWKKGRDLHILWCTGRQRLSFTSAETIAPFTHSGI